MTKYRLRFPRMKYWVKTCSIWTSICWVNFKFSLQWTQVFCNNHRFIVNSLGKISSPKTWINLKNQTIKASIITTVIISLKWRLRQVWWTANSLEISVIWPNSKAQHSTTNTTARRKALVSCVDDSWPFMARRKKICSYLISVQRSSA